MLKYILTIFFSFSVSIGCVFSQTYLNLDWSKDQIEVNSDYNSSLIGLFSKHYVEYYNCLLYTSPSPRDMRRSRMPSSA